MHCTPLLSQPLFRHWLYWGNDLPDGGFPSRLEANRDRMGSALASLASTASALNVGEYYHFAKALTLDLSRSTYFENSKSYESSQLRKDIFKFQIKALKKHYFKLVDAKSPQAFKVLDGTESQLTLHTYIFDVEGSSQERLCRFGQVVQNNRRRC